MEKMVALLVEDDRLLHSCMKEYLEEAGFEVVIAMNHTEAIAAFEANKSDLWFIALDGCLYGKSDLNTVDLAEQFSQDLNFVGMIVATASNQRHNYSLIKAGCDGSVGLKHEIFRLASEWKSKIEQAERCVLNDLYSEIKSYRQYNKYMSGREAVEHILCPTT